VAETNHTASNAPETAFRIRHLFYLLGAVLFALAVISHNARDYALRAGGIDGDYQNWIGRLGAVTAGELFHYLGLSSYVLAVIVMFAALRPFLPIPVKRQWFWPGVLFTLFGTTLLLALDPASSAALCAKLGLGRAEVPALSLSGGVIGQVLAAPGWEDLPPGALRMLLGPVGSSIVGSIFLLAGVIMLYRSEWHTLVLTLMHSLQNGVDEDADTPRKRVQALAPAGDAPETVAAPLPEPKRREAEAPVRVPGSESSSMPIPEPAPLPVSALEPEPTPAPGTISMPTAEPEPPPAPAPTAAAPTAAAARESQPLASGELAKPTVVEAGKAQKAERCENYALPRVDSLGLGKETSGENLEAIQRNTELLQQVLADFKIDGQVVGHISGPRVTRYEIRLAPNVKVRKVTEIEDDIAMRLRAKSLRILAPVPGRDVVGVELPNSHAEAIFLRSVMESDAWQKNSFGIPIALGKNISGEPIVIDLAKAPHLLIAGFTGSGKSVCMNTLIMSLLMKFSPDDLHLIMVDPKVVEMSAYQTLPHLRAPVIVDPKKAAIALRWAANEMDKRYLQIAKARVKNLKEYNRRPIPETPILDDDGVPLPDRMPVLIAIIDELADLMMSEAGKDIETSIARITAKGRAAGVHIVVATQSPRKDVITGTIKANLPTRIAFRVASLVDSRVILDQLGAEKLLGMGDMLLLSPSGGTELERIQGALVQDEDIEKVVNFVSMQAPQQFDDQVLEEPDEEEEEGASERGGAGRDWTEEDADAFIDSGFETDPMVQKYMQPGDDDLIRKTLEIILLEKKASTSYIQRRLKIGYNRAAELIDLMEERGIVGPPSGSGAKRDILVFDDVIQEP